MSSRGELFRMFVERDLSINMQIVMTAPMKNMTDEQKEERANQINIIINSCKTEKEMLRKMQEQNLV